MISGAPHTVDLRVSGGTYRVTLTTTPDGRVRWTTATRTSVIAGTEPTPMMALESAREWLQLRPSDELGEVEEQDLEALLEGSSMLAKGGVRKFGRAVNS